MLLFTPFFFFFFFLTAARLWFWSLDEALLLPFGISSAPGSGAPSFGACGISPVPSQSSCSAIAGKSHRLGRCSPASCCHHQPTPAPWDPQGSPGALPAGLQALCPAILAQLPPQSRPRSPAEPGGTKGFNTFFVAAKFKTLYHHKHSFIWAKPSRGAFYYPGLLNKNFPIMRRVDLRGRLRGMGEPPPGYQPRDGAASISAGDYPVPLRGFASPRPANNRGEIFALGESSWRASPGTTAQGLGGFRGSKGFGDNSPHHSSSSRREGPRAQCSTNTKEALTLLWNKPL